jgi:DNA repair protein RecO
MKNHKDHAIVLSRIDYGERDRILKLLCRDHGKVSALAKSVRSEKSRLAGGIELLSESEVSFVEGKSDLRTLTGARLVRHFDKLAGDIQRMRLAFGFIKIVNDISDEAAGQEYYPVLLEGLSCLNDKSYDPRVVETWFNLNLMKLSGSEPNLQLESNESENYRFDYDRQQFAPNGSGGFTKNDLKLLRVCSRQGKPPRLQKELGSEDRLQALIRTLLKTNLTEV